MPFGDTVGSVMAHLMGEAKQEELQVDLSSLRSFSSNRSPREAGVSWQRPMLPRVGFIGTNLSRPAERVVAFYNQRGTAEQHISKGKNAINLPRLPQQRGASSAARAGPRPGQHPAHARLARGGGKLVADDASREADQDRSEGRVPRPLHHLPDGGGRHPRNPVRRHPAPDRRAAASTLTALTAAGPVASGLLDRTGVCGALRGTLSQREKATGRAFDRQIGATKRGDRYADGRIRTGFAFDRHFSTLPVAARAIQGQLEPLSGRDRGPPVVRRARAGADPWVRCRERKESRAIPIDLELL